MFRFRAIEKKAPNASSEAFFGKTEGRSEDAAQNKTPVPGRNGG